MNFKISQRIITVLFLGQLLIFAQAPKMEWNKGYGTNNGEHIHEIMQTKDGGYIGIGQTDESGIDRYDILVVKTDSKGEYQWQKIIGTPKQNDIGICVEEASDGFVIGGGLFDGNQKRYMAKLDYEGKFLWQHTYPTERNGMIRGIDVLRNGELVTTGYKNCEQGGFVFIADNSDGYIMKTDNNGEIIWDKPLSEAQGAKVRKEINGDGFALCTTTWMNDPNHPQDMCLIKTDSEGNEIWKKNYGGESDEHCYDFDLTSDGGYILGGHTRSPSYGVVNWDFLIMKIDKDGNEEWHRTFGQPRGYDAKFIHDEAYGVRQTVDGGYVIVGGSGDEHEYSASGSPDGASDIWKVFLVKVDKSGKMEWQSVYGSNTENNAGEYLGLTNDGGFIIGSDSDSAGKEDYEPNNFGFMKIENDPRQLLKPGNFTIDTVIAPAINRDNSSWDGSMLESGDLFFHNETYYWYYHANGPNSKVGYEIGVATAANPLDRWERLSTPVLQSTETWESDFAACPYVIEHNNKFYMYYTGFDTLTEKSRMGIASSDNPIGPWRKEGIILTTKEASYVGSVCFVDNVWYLYYSRPDELMIDYGRIYVATSDNPIGPWKEFRTPVLMEGEKGAFDEGGFSEAEVSYSDGMFHMFYGGGKLEEDRSCVKESIGYAYSRDGYHFTKYVQNPVINRARIKDADALAEVHHLIRYPNIYIVFTYRRDNCDFEEDLGIVKLTVNNNK